MKNYFVLVLLFLSLSLFSQQNISKKSQFGISLGLQADHSNIGLVDFSTIGFADELNDVTSRTGAGFSIGVMYRYQLTSFVAARMQSVLSFASDRFFFDATTIPDSELKRDMVNIELPLHFVFEKTDRKIAPSAFFGGRFRYDVAESKRWAIIDFKPYDFTVDVGVGVAFNLKHFKFKPELTYSRGLLNQVDQVSEYQKGNAVDEIFTNQFGLRFLFYN